MGYLKEKIIYDMTSDTATKPTDQMFEIMKQATRGDDVYHVRSLTSEWWYQNRKEEKISDSSFVPIV